MTTWQTQVMEENAAAAQWEELTAPDPYEKEMENAAFWLQKAIRRLTEVGIDVEMAACELAGSPMQDKVESFVEEIHNLKATLEQLQTKYNRGERD